MISRFIGLVVICMGFLVSCKNTQRDIIQFAYPKETVSDSLREMKRILSELSLQSDLPINYGFDIDGQFFYSDIETTTFAGHSISSDSINEYHSFSPLENRLVMIARYLNQNHVSSAYFDEIWGDFLFTYKETKDNRYDDLRYLVIRKDNCLAIPRNPLEGFVILDSTRELLLVKPIELTTSTHSHR